MATTRCVRLRASDRIDYVGSEASLALQALDDADLGGAYRNAPLAGMTVGDFVLHSPSLFRKVTEDEAFDLNRARAAALRETERIYNYDGELADEAYDISVQDEESGAALVLLRPTRLDLTDEWSIDAHRELTYDMHLRSGDTIEATSRCPMPRRTWAVVKVEAIPYQDREREVWFKYEVVLAVPDNGALRVSDAASSLSKALCFDTVCRFLLSGLDLSEESLPDSAAAMDFINRIHTNGLPQGRMQPFEPTVSFRERLLEAMHPTTGSTGSLAGPERRLIKTFADAEIYAAEYLRYLGFVDAIPTPAGSDGGIDVVSRYAIAQVKMEGIATGRPVIQALLGVATIEGKMPVAFSLAGYTTQALEWADRARVACFEFAVDGSMVAVNAIARELRPPGQPAAPT